MLLLTSQTAAAVERYSCAEGNDRPTFFDVDRAANTFLTSEAGKVQLDRQPVCAAFAKVTGEVARALQPTCTVAFGEGVAVADYVALGEKSFNAMIALDSTTLKLTTIIRLGTSMAVVRTIPCKRL